jgi:hypothetical protein
MLFEVIGGQMGNRGNCLASLMSTSAIDHPNARVCIDIDEQPYRRIDISTNQSTQSDQSGHTKPDQPVPSSNINPPSGEQQ